MESSPPALEVICTDAEEALAAEAGGADRLELVDEADRGGLSPSVDMVEQVRRAVCIPMFPVVYRCSASSSHAIRAQSF